MKRIITLTSIIAIFLISCATFPEPQNSNDVLIVGKFNIEITDSNQKLDSSEKRMNESIDLTFKNTSTSEVFDVRTYDGFYYFVGTPDTEFILQSFTADMPPETGEKNVYSIFLISPANFYFKTLKNNISYFGNILITYTAMDFVMQTMHHENVVKGAKLDVNYDLLQIANYLERKDPDNLWSKDDIGPIKLYINSQ